MIPRVLLLTLAPLLPLSAAAPELRAVWVDRSSLESRQSIRDMMQSLAAAHCNAAFVNVWSRGYPLWPSDVFERETGLRIDPNFAGRDPLAELLEEGREAGIAVFPWAEYGFVGGYSHYLPGPIFAIFYRQIARGINPVLRINQMPALEENVVGWLRP